VKNHWLPLIAGIALVMGMWLIFRQPLRAMVSMWDVSPMYSYGYVVPIISAYLLWARRSAFAREPFTGSRILGGAVIVGSLVLLAVGRVIAVQVVEQLSFVATLAGITLFLFGRRVLALSAPALAYLLFMVPMWDAFTEPLHWPFQLTSAQLGVGLMRAVGVPAYREGSVIELPDVVLEVAKECSGVNYLVAVLAFALPMALLRLRSWWRRSVLVAVSLIVASFANSLRVALIGVLAYAEIGSPLHGPFHVLHGLFVSGIGFVMIFIGLRFLEDGDAPSSAAPDDAEPSASLPRRWPLNEFVLLASVVLALGVVGITPRMEEVVLRRPLESLPLQLGRWTALGGSSADRAEAPAAIVTAWSGADRKLERVYISEAGERVSVAVYYFAAQRQGREIVSSAASSLHRQASAVKFDGLDDFRFAANMVQWPDRNEVAVFWYDTSGHIEAGEIAAKISTMRRAILSGRTNGAAIVLRTSGNPHAITALQDFAMALRPALAMLWASETIS
jgi:EpsI family protein